MVLSKTYNTVMNGTEEHGHLCFASDFSGKGILFINIYNYSRYSYIWFCITVFFRFMKLILIGPDYEHGTV